jgi:hypothetical protein
MFAIEKDTWTKDPSANKSFERTTPAPHSVLPLAIGFNQSVEGSTKITYHHLLTGRVASAKPS